MTDLDSMTRCPQGHVTSGDFQFCTTCGERVLDGPDAPAAGSVATCRVCGAEVDARYRFCTECGQEWGPESADEPAAPLKSRPMPVAPHLEDPDPSDDLPIPAAVGLSDQPLPVLDPPDEPAGPLVAEHPDDLAASLRGPDLLRGDVDPPSLSAPDAWSAAPASGDLESPWDGENVSVDLLPPPSSISRPPPYRSVDDEFAIGAGVRSSFSSRAAGAEPSRPKRTPRLRSGTRSPKGRPVVLIALLIVLAAVVVFVLLKNRSTEAPQASPSAPSATEAATADASEAPATAAPVVVSEECGNAFLFAEAHQGEPETSSLQQRTLDLCSTRAEWIAAAKLHPGAVGLSDSAVVDEDVDQLCGASPERALCRG